MTLQGAIGELEDADGVGGLTAPLGRGPRVEEALAGHALGVNRHVAVAEHDDISVGEVERIGI